MVKPVYEQARRTWLCIGCGNPRENRSIDLAIQEDEPDNTPLNMVSGCTVGIGPKDFLFSFCEEVVRQHLHLGQVFGPDERPLANWMTFVGCYRIIVRGSKNVAIRQCSDCGKAVYFGMDQRYLYPQPSPGISVFDAGSGGLVVTEEFVRGVNLNAWRKLECTKLPVLEVPKDGVHELRGM